MHHAGIVWLGALLFFFPAMLVLSRYARIGLSKQFVPGYAASLGQSGGLLRAKPVLRMLETSKQAATVVRFWLTQAPPSAPGRRFAIFFEAASRLVERP